jgi:predicted lipoprotein with Yx(FWY)xxD motif
MTEGDGQVVYTYASDSAGKPATCTGSCATTWVPVKGTGLVSPADHTFPGTFGQIDGQITYDGLPLYTYKGAPSYQNHASGPWKSIKLPESLVIQG